jgi:branched-chain amino acid transport system substrate-binding protein
MRSMGWIAFGVGLMLAGPGWAQALDGPVKIGILNDQSGPYADFGGVSAVDAARMAIEDFGGKVLGKPIELVTADHQNKPDIASAVANRWFDVEGVDMVGDLTNSAVALAVQKIAQDKNRITITNGAATARLTGDSCSPTGIHWAYDTYSQAVGAGRAMLAEGVKKWFVLTVDYAFGHALEADIMRVVKEGGGQIVGNVRHPLNTPDFSSYLLQAQSSGAQGIGLANAGVDTVNSIKQAAEFGISQGGQRILGLLMVISDVHSLGLSTAQGLTFAEAWYWDQDEAARAGAKRVEARNKRMPGMIQAGVYSSTLHYLKAVQAAGTKEAKAVMAKMREIPVDDFFARNGKLREDGRMVHDMLLVEVKKPEESKGEWDLHKIIRKIPADQASACPLVKKT